MVFCPGGLCPRETSTGNQKSRQYNHSLKYLEKLSLFINCQHMFYYFYLNFKTLLLPLIIFMKKSQSLERNVSVLHWENNLFVLYFVNYEFEENIWTLALTVKESFYQTSVRLMLLNVRRNGCQRLWKTFTIVNCQISQEYTPRVQQVHKFN